MCNTLWRLYLSVQSFLSSFDSLPCLLPCIAPVTGFTSRGLWSHGAGNELFVDSCWFREIGAEKDVWQCHNGTAKTGTGIWLDNNDHSIANVVVYCSLSGVRSLFSVTTSRFSSLPPLHLSANTECIRVSLLLQARSIAFTLHLTSTLIHTHSLSLILFHSLRLSSTLFHFLSFSSTHFYSLPLSSTLILSLSFSSTLCQVWSSTEVRRSFATLTSTQWDRTLTPTAARTLLPAHLTSHTLRMCARHYL